MNKKMFVLIFVLCISLVFVGCNKKLPEGIQSQTFYDDMIQYSDDLIKITRNAKNTNIINSDILNSDAYYSIINYKENMEDLTLTEKEIIETMEDLYLQVAIYYDTGSDIKIKDIVQKISSLLEIDIDISKLKFK